MRRFGKVGDVRKCRRRAGSDRLDGSSCDPSAVAGGSGCSDTPHGGLTSLRLAVVHLNGKGEGMSIERHIPTMWPAGKKTLGRPEVHISHVSEEYEEDRAWHHKTYDVIRLQAWGHGTPQEFLESMHLMKLPFAKRYEIVGLPQASLALGVAMRTVYDWHSRTVVRWSHGLKKFMPVS